VTDDTSRKPTMNKTRRYIIIGLACVAVIATLFVYQSTEFKTQAPAQVQDVSNVTKSEQTTQIVQSSYTSQEPNMTQTTINIALLEQDIHKIANQARQTNGVQPINYDFKLADIARTHSQDMAIHQFLSDNTYDGGHNLNYRYTFAGYTCQATSSEYSTSNENIAVVTVQGNETQIAQHIVNTWLDSVADRNNILDSGHQNEGIGVALTENKMAVYATQDLC